MMDNNGNPHRNLVFVDGTQTIVRLSEKGAEQSTSNDSVIRKLQAAGKALLETTINSKNKFVAIDGLPESVVIKLVAFSSAQSSLFFQGDVTESATLALEEKIEMESRAETAAIEVGNSIVGASESRGLSGTEVEVLLSNSPSREISAYTIAEGPKRHRQFIFPWMTVETGGNRKNQLSFPNGDTIKLSNCHVTEFRSGSLVELRVGSIESSSDLRVKIDIVRSTARCEFPKGGDLASHLYRSMADSRLFNCEVDQVLDPSNKENPWRFRIMNVFGTTG